MMHACEISKEPGLQGVCGLLGKQDTGGGDPEGFSLVLRELVEHFQITWAVSPLRECVSGESVEMGFVLELKGTHEPVSGHVGRRCPHCANLLMAMRIIGEWLFPPDGSCEFCELRIFNNFVRGEEDGLSEPCSMKVFCLASHVGARCQLGSCHAWCEATLRERLNRIGSVER
jgi:hypothetical protein